LGTPVKSIAYITKITDRLEIPKRSQKSRSDSASRVTHDAETEAVSRRR